MNKKQIIMTTMIAIVVICIIWGAYLVGIGPISLTTYTTTETTNLTTTATIEKTVTNTMTSPITTTITQEKLTTSTTTVTLPQMTSISTTTATTSVQGEAVWEVCFSPGGGCASELISWIDRANKTVHVMIYSFTRDDVSSSLIRAEQRGVDVKVVMDDEQINVSGGEYSKLVNARIDVRIDERSGLMHSKVAIIDGWIVITGSYNWSTAAEDSNRENLLVIEDTSLASKYEANFIKVWAASAQTSSSTTATATTTTPSLTCDPSYPSVCILPPPPDLDCNEIPYSNFKVLPPDPHGFDGDGDGIGCEKYP